MEFCSVVLRLENRSLFEFQCLPFVGAKNIDVLFTGDRGPGKPELRK